MYPAYSCRVLIIYMAEKVRENQHGHYFLGFQGIIKPPCRMTGWPIKYRLYYSVVMLRCFMHQPYLD